MITVSNAEQHIFNMILDANNSRPLSRLLLHAYIYMQASTYYISICAFHQSFPLIFKGHLLQIMIFRLFEKDYLYFVIKIALNSAIIY